MISIGGSYARYGKVVITTKVDVRSVKRELGQAMRYIHPCLRFRKDLVEVGD